jgi:hypothetical protein
MEPKIEDQGSRIATMQTSAPRDGKPSRARSLAILYPLTSILALSAGCQRVLPPKVEPVVLMEDRIPLEPDEATVIRAFDGSTSYYPNGATEAGSTRFPWGPRARASNVENELMGLPIFAANVVSLPFTYFVKPPFSPYVYPGAVTSPTYTAMPAYPTEAPAPGPTDAPAPPTADGPVPPAQAPVPSVNEPVRETTGEQPPSPTENTGPNEIPITPPDSTPAPVTPPTGGAVGAP